MWFNVCRKPSAFTRIASSHLCSVTNCVLLTAQRNPEHRGQMYSLSRYVAFPRVYPALRGPYLIPQAQPAMFSNTKKRSHLSGVLRPIAEMICDKICGYIVLTSIQLQNGIGRPVFRFLHSHETLENVLLIPDLPHAVDLFCINKR